jgi:hypothetical protein
MAIPFREMARPVSTPSSERGSARNNIRIGKRTVPRSLSVNGDFGENFAIVNGRNPTVDVGFKLPL